LFIPDPDRDFLPIPYPGSRSQKGTGSRIRPESGSKLCAEFGSGSGQGTYGTYLETQNLKILVEKISVSDPYSFFPDPERLRLETNTDPDPIRIQGFNDQKLKKNIS
jgi:hypothetical protein